MGHSSLLGTEEAPTEAKGRDTAALGPGDNSDSGSDMMGITDADGGGDPDLPVDVALRDENPHTLASESVSGSTSDAGGTGERRSAAADAGREAADIGVDRIVSGPGLRAGSDEDQPDDEDADLAFIDAAQAGDPTEDEEDPDEQEEPADGDAGEGDPDGLEEDDNIPQGRGRVSAPASQTPTLPGRPNPEPDVPDPLPGDTEEEDPPADEQDSEERKPGRTAALLRRR
jgi:hypothetical protein